MARIPAKLELVGGTDMTATRTRTVTDPETIMTVKAMVRAGQLGDHVNYAAARKRYVKLIAKAEGSPTVDKEAAWRAAERLKERAE